MARTSEPQLLVLHAVRLLGFADTPAVADRAGTGPDETAALLDEAARRGWLQRSSFADLGGWWLTEDGKGENERELARERESADPGGVIAATYREFLPLNASLQRACTDWQLKPTALDRLAPNDHTDADWDARVLDELTAIGAALAPLAERLTGVLVRFGGYHARFDTALERARAGRGEWVDGTDIDSCHRVWFQLHEDLIATLGVDRGAEG
ncbi:transcriptional regulator [Occultella gossypii]|uniref:Transcriptional regulator n=1 Tax=Occultella gossypii TaxID=2800820 RepID=A0ABS7S930_9MICO|nr:transcriptional regulator [Occultella gossypii]MBZ2196792.1 transcriptional regulator [Occultella gossypii]